jgi:gliding motility-associated-like protein
MSFILYDRWGEKVFESTSPSLGWDGVFNGRQMESAVFYYYLEAKTIDGKSITKKGNVSLIR